MRDNLPNNSDAMKQNADPPNGIAAALLLDARRRADLTQDEIARRTGLSSSLVSLYETGEQEPTLSQLAMLIAACGMELRISAQELEPADIAQYERDAAMSQGQALRNAARAKREIISVRPLKESDPLLTY